MTQPLRHMTPDEARARSKRNIAIALGLAAFMVLVFIVTLARLKAQVATDTLVGPL